MNKKEVTIQLQVVNNEKSIKPTGEIMLVIDNSDSMLDEVDNTTREDLVVNSAKTLVSKLLKDNDNLKIGVVSFSSNTDVSKEGTIEDASLVSELSNDASKLNNSISNIQYNGPRTDLDAGITLAKQHFTSEKNNKYMIVLTDGVPNIAIDFDKNYFSDDVIKKTNTSLVNVEKNNISLITMLTGISEPDKKPLPSVDKTYAQIITEIFGTQEKPTAGKFYYIQDDKIEETITKDIYNDLLPIEKI